MNLILSLFGRDSMLEVAKRLVCVPLAYGGIYMMVKFKRGQTIV